MKVTKLLLVTLLALPLLGCSGKPGVALTARYENSDLVFDIKKTRVKGLLEFAIWQTEPREDFWKVNLNYYDGSTLIYGRTPTNFLTFNGVENMARQEFPATGMRPRALTPNKTFRIALTYLGSTLFDESSGTLYFSATTDSSGKIVSLNPTSSSQRPIFACDQPR